MPSSSASASGEPTKTCYSLGFLHRSFLVCCPLTIILEIPFDALLHRSLYFPDLKSSSLCFPPLFCWSTSTSSFSRRDIGENDFFKPVCLKMSLFLSHLIKSLVGHSLLGRKLFPLEFGRHCSCLFGSMICVRNYDASIIFKPLY